MADGFREDDGTSALALSCADGFRSLVGYGRVSAMGWYFETVHVPALARLALRSASSCSSLARQWL